MTASAKEIERLDSLKNDKKFVSKAFWTYNWAIPMCFTRERMLGLSMTSLMLNVAEDLYPGDVEKQKRLGLNHCVFFNTQQGLGAVIYGTCLGLEVERAKADEVPNEVIQSIKTALAGPIAGIGDSLIQALLTPIIISIGIGMSSTGSPMGPIFMFLAYTIANGVLSYLLFRSGFRLGLTSADILVNSGVKDRLIPALETLGVLVIGGVLASIMNVKSGLIFTSGELTVNFQTQVFDAFLPKCLSLAAALITFWLIKYKKMSAQAIILWMIPVAAIGYFTTLLA
ncbi:MAG: PTS system mannose/fructose/sorbose family transporter subunit IID [Erysipelotrichaceae bacterium]|jgi:PTS system mannose-specific IID component|nr:PTS system mannose/fructose/sorbose family transporter subunit IID [Erysipelotrichaceae bacterium]